MHWPRKQSRGVQQLAALDMAGYSLVRSAKTFWKWLSAEWKNCHQSKPKTPTPWDWLRFANCIWGWLGLAARHVSLMASRHWSHVSGKPAAVFRVWVEAACVQVTACNPAGWGDQQTQVYVWVRSCENFQRCHALPLSGVSDLCHIDHLAKESFSLGRGRLQSSAPGAVQQGWAGRALQEQSLHLICAAPSASRRAGTEVLPWAVCQRAGHCPLAQLTSLLRYGKPHVDLHLNYLPFDTCISRHGLLGSCHWAL